LKREFQCATIQLDFQNPENFNLQYVLPQGVDQVKAEAEKKTEPPAAAAEDADPSKASKIIKPGCARPVMIHRAIYGSFERFMGIVIEHLAGKWPFWLSPRQVLIVPVNPSLNDYCTEVQKIFRSAKLHVDVDLSGETMKKKIREGQLKQYNFIFVLGKEEEDSRSVNIRNRDDQDSQKRGEVVKLDEALKKMAELRDSRRLENQLL
jgi:threonyl-tRNA synthetase